MLKRTLKFFQSVFNFWNNCADSFQDREPVSKHLPLAWTRSSAAEDEKLMTILDEFSDKIAKTFLFKHSEDI